MGLLTSGIQVRPAVVHAIIELLVAAKRPIATDELEQLLQPPSIEDLTTVKPPENAVQMTSSLCVQLGLADEVSGALVLTPETDSLELSSLNRKLPEIVRDRMIAPRSGEGTDTRECDDLVLTLGWFMAQNSWDPCLTVDGLGDSWESRLAAQLPNGAISLNTTKARQLFHWAEYLGLASPDPIELKTWIPDPTRLIRQTLGSMSAGRTLLVDMIESLSSRYSVLDNGQDRKAALSGLAPGQLPWEVDQGVLSPSISLALLRLAHAKEIELVVEADTPRRCRLTNRDGRESVVDIVRLISTGEELS